MNDKDKGYISVSNKFIRDESLTHYEKMLFCVLYSYRGLVDIYPSYETLCLQTGFKRTKLIETIKLLEDKKYIKVVKNNYRKTNSYQILKTFKVRHTDAGVRETDVDVRHTDVIGSPHEPVPVRHTNPNNKYINNKTLIKEKEKKKKVSPDNGLPDWLDKVVWEEWIVYRKGLGKKYILSPSTISKQLKRLEKYKSQHVEIINKTIERGWIGLVYPDDHKNFNNNNNKNGKIKVTGGKYADYAERLQRSDNQSGEG